MLRCSETIKARRRYICPSIYLRAWTRKEGEKAGTKEKDTPTRYGPGHGRVVLQQRKRVHIDLYIDTHVPEYNICARISTLGLTWGFGNQGEGGVSTPPLVQIRLYQRDFLMYKSNSIIWFEHEEIARKGLGGIQPVRDSRNPNSVWAHTNTHVPSERVA